MKISEIISIYSQMEKKIAILSNTLHRVVI